MSFMGGGYEGPSQAEYDAKRKLEEKKLEAELAEQKTEVNQKMIEDKAAEAEQQRTAAANRKKTLLDVVDEEDDEESLLAK